MLITQHFLLYPWNLLLSCNPVLVWYILISLSVSLWFGCLLYWCYIDDKIVSSLSLFSTILLSFIVDLFIINLIITNKWYNNNNNNNNNYIIIDLIIHVLVIPYQRCLQFSLVLVCFYSCSFLPLHDSLNSTQLNSMIWLLCSIICIYLQTLIVIP